MEFKTALAFSVLLAACSAPPGNDLAPTEPVLETPPPYPDYGSSREEAWGPCNKKHTFHWDGGVYEIPVVCERSYDSPLWDPPPERIQKEDPSKMILLVPTFQGR